MKFRFFTLVVFFIGLVMIPKEARLVSIHDDDDYLAYATAIAYGNYPSFASEFHYGEKIPFAHAGPGVLASPFVFFGSLIDRATDNPIVERRTKENRYWTWTTTGFHLSTIVYLFFGFYFLFLALNRIYSPIVSELLTLSLLLFGGGILVYVFRRPIMSHVYEFFAISGSLFFVGKLIQGRRSISILLYLSLFSSLVFLTRYNNLFLAIVFHGFAIYTVAKDNGRYLWAKISSIILIPFVIFFFFKMLPILSNGFSKFDQSYGGGVGRLIEIQSLTFYLERLLDIFFGLDMGLIFTAPAIVIGFLGIIFFWRKIHIIYLILAFSCLVNLFVVMQWKSFGSYYGYRYLTFSVGPILAFYLGQFLYLKYSKLQKIFISVVILCSMFFTINSFLALEKYSEFSFFLFKNKYNIETYTQPNYHLSLIEFLIKDPIHFFVLGWRDGFRSLYLDDSWSANEMQKLTLIMAPLAFFLFMELFRLVKKARRNTAT